MAVSFPAKTDLKIRARIPMGRLDPKQYYTEIGLSYLNGNKDSYFSFNLHSGDKTRLINVIGSDNFIQAQKLLKPLHLADRCGVPMYAKENGFYYCQIALGSANHHKAENGDREKYTGVLSRHLRITLDDANKIINDLSVMEENEARAHFGDVCDGMIERWETEAEEAIQFLQTIKYLSH